MSQTLPAKLTLLLQEQQFGILSSFFSEDPNFPFCSLMQYCYESPTSLIFKTAHIAEHHKNLSLNGNASLFIAGIESQNPLSQSRLTLLLHCQIIEQQEVPKVREAWEHHTLKVIPPEIENSFAYWRATIKKVRWIAGFGEMGWITYDSVR